MARDSTDRRERLVESAAANGKSLMVLTGEDLARLLQITGGGLAQGNNAMANSLGAQSTTIQEQNEQNRKLLNELLTMTQRVAQLERANLDHDKFREQIALARDAMVRDSATKAEMLGIVKTAAMAFLGHMSGAGLPPEAASVVARAAMPAPSAGGAPEAAPGEGRKGAMPTTMAGAVREAVARLSPETIEEILVEAEKPNPRIPNNAPTLVAIVQIMLGSLDAGVLRRIQDEVGPEFLAHVAVLMGAPAG